MIDKMENNYFRNLCLNKDNVIINDNINQSTKKINKTILQRFLSLF